MIFFFKRKEKTIEDKNKTRFRDKNKQYFLLIVIHLLLPLRREYVLLLVYVVA